jgi:anti-sigma factor RsiW
MKCSNVRKRLCAYRDSELPDNQKALISQHLESCADCRLELDKLTRLSNELALLKDVPVRPYFMTRVRQRIADRQAESFRARRVPAWDRSHRGRDTCEPDRGSSRQDDVRSKNA